MKQIDMKESGMDKYFTEVITSEAAGTKKPNPEIFNFAFNESGAKPENSVMIGDDYEVDIIGAKEVGMKQIFFDPYSKRKTSESTYYINSLKEIINIL